MPNCPLVLGASWAHMLGGSRTQVPAFTGFTFCVVEQLATMVPRTIPAITSRLRVREHCSTLWITAPMTSSALGWPLDDRILIPISSEVRKLHGKFLEFVTG